MAMTHNYTQQVFEQFVGKANRGKRLRLIEMIFSEFSDKDNQNLQTNEVKVFVCGVSNLFLRYRDQLKLDQETELYPIIVRALNALFWQKYQQDKLIYKTNNNQKDRQYLTKPKNQA